MSFKVRLLKSEIHLPITVMPISCLQKKRVVTYTCCTGSLRLWVPKTESSTVSRLEQTQVLLSWLTLQIRYKLLQFSM